MQVGRTNRRAFIAGLGGAAAWPIVARGQKRNPNVGWLIISPNPDYDTAARRGLADFGYVVGQNISPTIKNAAGNHDQLNRLAEELVEAHVDVLVGWGSQPTSVLKRQTTRAVIARLNAALNKALTDAVRGSLAKLDTDVGGGTTEEFGALVHAETVRWTKVIKDAGIKINT